MTQGRPPRLRLMDTYKRPESAIRTPSECLERAAANAALAADYLRLASRTSDPWTAHRLRALSDGHQVDADRWRRLAQDGDL